LNGSSEIEILPVSGTDISATGRELLMLLGEHVDNIPPTGITPQAVNGMTMKPLDKLPVTLCLGDKQYRNDVHIYPGVSGALISWRASKGPGILPEHYPYPIHNMATSLHPAIKATSANQPIDFSKEYPTVFDGIIRYMNGEEFHISLTKHAKPSCIYTPRSIPSAISLK